MVKTYLVSIYKTGVPGKFKVVIDPEPLEGEVILDTEIRTSKTATK